MIERNLIIRNELGLHARAAAKLVHTASRYSCKVFLIDGEDEINAKSILGLLALGVEPGSEVTMRCDGDSELEAMGSLEELFAEGFGEIGEG